MPFQQIIMHALHYQHDVDVHLLFCFDIDPHLPVPKFMYKLDFLRRFSLMGTTSCAVPNNPPGMTGCPTMPFQQIIMHALQCQNDLDVHLLFCVDLDLHITSSRGHVGLEYSLSVLTDRYHFACSAQQKLCLFNKLSCMHCTTNMT